MSGYPYGGGYGGGASSGSGWGAGAGAGGGPPNPYATPANPYGHAPTSPRGGGVPGAGGYGATGAGAGAYGAGSGGYGGAPSGGYGGAPSGTGGYGGTSSGGYGGSSGYGSSAGGSTGYGAGATSYGAGTGGGGYGTGTGTAGGYGAATGGGGYGGSGGYGSTTGDSYGGGGGGGSGAYGGTGYGGGASSSQYGTPGSSQYGGGASSSQYGAPGSSQYSGGGSGYGAGASQYGGGGAAGTGTSQYGTGSTPSPYSGGSGGAGSYGAGAYSTGAGAGGSTASQYSSSQYGASGGGSGYGGSSTSSSQYGSQYGGGGGGGTPALAVLEAQRAAEDERRRKADQEMQRKIEEAAELERKRLWEQEMAKKAAEEERQKRLAAEAEKQRLAQEAERVKQEYAAKLEALQRSIQEEKAREAEAARKRAADEARQRALEEEQRRKREEEERRLQMMKEEEVRRQQEARMKQMEADFQAKMQLMAQETERQKADAARREAEQAERLAREARLKAEEDEMVMKLVLQQALEDQKREAALAKRRWEVTPDELKFGPLLGKGAFGEVWKGTLHGKEVAIKKLLTQRMDDDTMASFRAELELMSNLRHPNLLLFMAACLEPGNMMIVTEFMPRGALGPLLHQGHAFSFKQKMAMAKDVCSGMSWLHNQKPPVLHRDLKPENMLVDLDWHVHVADFGLSQMKTLAAGNPDGKAHGGFGSPFYMAPELLQDKPFDHKLDVYSFGICLWEIYTQEEPYKDLFSNYDELAEGVGLDEERPQIPNHMPPLLRSLVEACWDQTPANRPNFEDILNNRTFDVLIVDGIVHEPAAAEMWKRSFLNRMPMDEVPWPDFAGAFCAFFQMQLSPDDIKTRCLQALVANDKGLVTLEAWGQTANHLGPCNGQAFVDKLHNMLSAGWFHGDLGAQNADRILRKAKRGGAYLVRYADRTESNGCPAFVVSLKSKEDGNVVHHTVALRDGKLVADGAPYDTMDEVLIKQRRPWGLGVPCIGSKYDHMFPEEDA